MCPLSVFGKTMTKSPLCSLPGTVKTWSLSCPYSDSSVSLSLSLRTSSRIGTFLCLAQTSSLCSGP